MNNVFDLDTIPENHSLVTGGMLGIKIICDMLIEKGDEVVIVGPVWPNIRSSVILKEGKIKEVNLEHKKISSLIGFNAAKGQWIEIYLLKKL